METRELLLQAAEGLFVRRGYEAVSTREIADAAQVNLGAIQYHFGSKGRLFVETVHRLMQAEQNALFHSWLERPPQSQAEAAYRLCGFIAAFLHHLVKPSGPQACRVMFREIMTETTEHQEVFDELVSSVCDSFVMPVHRQLLKLLAPLAPDHSDTEIALCASSVAAQCSFYITHKPFVEKVRGIDLTDESTLNIIGRHVAVFSLRAMAVRDEVMQAAVTQVFDRSGANPDDWTSGNQY